MPNENNSEGIEPTETFNNQPPLDKGVEGRRSLKESLIVSGPFKAENAPTAYSFQRNNQIEIAWDELMGKLGIILDETNWRRFETYVKLNWDGDVTEASIKKHSFVLDPGWPAFTHDPDAIQNLRDVIPPGALAVFQKKNLADYRVAPHAGAALPIGSGCVLKIKTGAIARWYRPVSVSDGIEKIVTKAMFVADWEGTWQIVTGLVQVYFEEPPPNLNGLTADEKKAAQGPVVEAACKFFPASELIRADAATILHQYATLKEERALAAGLNAKAADVANQIGTSPIESIPQLMEQFRSLKRFSIENAESRRKLSDAASDLNYHLFTENTTITAYQDGTGAPQDVTLTEGELYTKSTRVANWQTFHTVTKKKLFSKKSYQVATNHSITFDYYEKAQTDFDPWVEVLEYLTRANFLVFLFRYSRSGDLVAADGATPSDIVERCHTDEEFRRRCVIALPRKELSIFGDEFIIGYDVIYRPVPDIAPMYPTLSVQEKLSYRFAWDGAALGELAATIPLSPGEEREVSLTSTYKYETSRTETATSLVDITRIDRSDFETVFEKEVRRDKETTTAASATASGSYGGIVSGSGSFSTTTTTKDMARQLNRAVQRASQEVNRRSKEERTVTVSEKTETTQQNVVKYKVKNINQGTTLNVAFYRLQNVYRSLLRVDGIAYAIKGGRSVISSSDLREEITKEVDSVTDLASWLKEGGNFPYDISALDTDTLADALREAILEQLAKEYDTEKEGKAISGELRLLATEVKGLAAAKIASLTNEPDGVEARLTMGLHIRRALRDAQDKVIDSVFKAEETIFAYESGALYADLYIGDRPGTEPYSENMRRLEEQKLSAENSVVRARARYLNARSSKQLMGIGGIIDASKVYATNADVLYHDDDHTELKLLLVPSSLWDGGWSVIFKKMGEGEGLAAGNFLQSDNFTPGILSFTLPKRFKNIVDLKSKSHQWFEQNVSLRNVELALTVAYRKPQ